MCVLFFRYTYNSVRPTTKQSHTRLALRQHWNNPERKLTLGLKNKLKVSWTQPNIFPLLLSQPAICFGQVPLLLHMLLLQQQPGHALQCGQWAETQWEDRERAAHLSSFRYPIQTSVSSLRRLPWVLLCCSSAGPQAQLLPWCCTHASQAEKEEERNTSACQCTPRQVGMPTQLYHSAPARGAGLLLPGVTSWWDSIWLPASSCLPWSFSGEGVNLCQLARRIKQQTALET